MALGVAVATAVLTGALLVGDSVRGSLRDLTLQRLGRIDSALVTGHMFRAALADELAADAEFEAAIHRAEPAILMTGTLQAGSGKDAARATRVNVIGCRESFWSLGQGGPAKPLAANEVAITEPLARELGVKAGDELLLRIPTSGRDSGRQPAGRKGRHFETAADFASAAVLPPRGLARFGLMPSQHLPRNVFVPLDDAARAARKAGQGECDSRGAPDADRASDEAASRRLRPQPSSRELEDYGLKVEQLLVAGASTSRLRPTNWCCPTAVVRAAERAFRALGCSRSSRTWPIRSRSARANAERKIPYSTITGVDSTAAIGPLLDEAGQPIVLADDEIVLNRWAADDLQAKVGDTVTVTFYEPESTHGVLREHQPPPTFKLRAIVDLETADGKPTPAADPQAHAGAAGRHRSGFDRDWDLPFELVEKIRPQDEDYWDEYRTTPEGVCLARHGEAACGRAAGARSACCDFRRIGESLRRSDGDRDVYANARPQSRLEAGRRRDDVPAGEAQGLAAASGTTPFDGCSSASVSS